ncbi:hypothetical protein D0817_23675 [Flavobacterium cupreum]|uniref:PA14 domain-containing protein n=2 Tax=Flavobacterium TaxID=237 RepID=A0A434A0P8_9FLAO|nr:hypothetical protein [Flavobacterium cupreum]RUT67936.1 hypothetical protein D0817_23675 [Flavobacterium cupreum]
MIQPKINKFKKTLAIYLAMMILLETIQPMQIYALTGGPSQPEFESFTPIGTSDMVDLSSGDFNYNIPIMDVGGYPINLAYNSGVSMDQEASWVGLGWDLNVGQISRQLRGLPDDFNGDEMTYENSMKPNVTVGSNFNVFVAGFGVSEARASVGMAIKYNNYDGFGATASGGMSVQIADNLRVGMDLQSSASEGVSASPTITLDNKNKNSTTQDNVLTGSLGVTYNSRKGIEGFTMSASRSRKDDKQRKIMGGEHKGEMINGTPSFGAGGAISFIDASYTPTKRVGMVSTNFMFNLNIEGEIWGVEPGMKFTGYRTSQGIKNSEKYKIEKAYGYENTYNAATSDILDFNREKDRTFNKNTTSLPITSNTYDIYNIQGQGISGMYRPYKSQVGYVYDNETNDDTAGGNLGLEFGAGGGVHWGFDATATIGKSSSAVWKTLNPALGRFKEKKDGNRPDYEKVFFKNIGGAHVDKELDLFSTQMGGYDAVKFGLEGGKFSRRTNVNYSKNSGTIANTGILKRESSRLSRNQSIQKLTKLEAKRFGSKLQANEYARDHHTAEVRITKEGGERYIYGKTAYNVIKKEVTFDVSNKSNPNEKVKFDKGLVEYNPGVDNSAKNNKDGDQYFNRVTTPAYAHSYLLTSVLSPDYQDLKNDGPTDDDLGNYTKFEYENKTPDKDNLYKWRIPFLKNHANYDEGLRSSRKDNKGNYQYGEKELIYIKKIVTKTHVAIFHLSVRNDGYGVEGENGGLSDKSKMYKLDKISLYSKPEYLASGDEATPIKEANFEYNYSLCPGIDNSITKEGKLTLSKVYFTYKNSNMGKFTPYVFTYGFNPAYDMKAYDVWGNYKLPQDKLGPDTTSNLSNAEYPFVDQSNRATADEYAAAWLLKSIHLPSGGEMELKYESDDYSSVQNKDVMQMFKVVGSGPKTGLTASNISNIIEKRNLGEYIYVELDHKIDDKLAINDPKIAKIFYDKYIRNLGEASNPLYFRFLLNMANPTPIPGIDGSDKYDYVTGYVNISKKSADTDYGFLEVNGKQYVAIPVDYVGKGDGFNAKSEVNPITKAGWNFGRQNLNRLVYSMTNEEDTTDLKGIVMELIGWIPTLLDIFKSPNAKLEQNGIASKFVTDKSWIRLFQPESRKIGGGSRVHDIRINDQWNVMTNNPTKEIYQQSYGQIYSYDAENGKSSGVATYEPLGCKENPFVKPFYDEKKRELLLGPDSSNYVEEPFGESFFPSPKITYSRVTVTNLPRDKQNASNEITSIVKKHATGSVVTEFYTSKDYPTITDRTTLSSNYDKSSALASILNLSVKDHITLSQGFAVHTNDMDGKMKNQRVYAEGQTDFISGVDYKYKTLPTSKNRRNSLGKLDNTVQTIDSKGVISDKLVGVDYDVINDFRESKSNTETAGIHFNTAGLPLFLVLVIVPVPLPSYSRHESLIRTAVTTKVIHTTALLSEKIAYDLGSKVSTKNLAWDAETGDLLLTETVNEYNDKYFSLNFPAYWAYAGMSQASKNIGLEWDITATGGKYQLNGTHLESDYLIDGDELWLTGLAPDKKTKTLMKAWAVHVTDSNFKLIDDKGLLIKPEVINTAKMKVIRSGYRNMQMASMASVTSMTNPLYDYDANNTIVKVKGNIGENPYMSTTAVNRIVNASAVQYNDKWPSQCECDLPKMTFATNGEMTFEYEKENNTAEEDDILKRSFNPYLYNILGNWRANKSYAYLTGRNYTIDPTPRKTGFFNDFFPFYVFDTTKNTWGKTAANYDRWTFASEVTQYSPAGQEVENKDALKRYSSALYGYNNRFPVAVASNTKYTELASDGFEDYDLSNCGNASHFDFQAQLKVNDVSVSDKQSHTGRKSLKIAPSKKAIIKKQVVSCSTPAPAVTAKK